MRKILLLILFLTILSCKSQNEDESEQINVLLIGNSLTYYNDMPQMLQEMVNETKRNINIEQITYPGFSLYAHLENIVEESSADHVSARKKSEGEKTETEKKIQEKKWDVIVMQTGGVTILIPEIRKEKVNPAIKEIINLNDPNSKYILFKTWTTKVDYPEQYCYPKIALDQNISSNEKVCSPEISDQKEYFQLLQKGYKELSEDNNITLTNHLELFDKVHRNNSEINLLEDTMHPSKEGAFLSACILYQILTGKKANNLNYSASLKPEIANILKNAAS